MESAQVSLPADDAPHESYTEWWYYNGHLETQAGRRYSFHYVVFLIDSLLKHAVAHVSFFDHQTGDHYTDEARTTGRVGRAVKEGFFFQLNDWLMAGSGGNDALKVKAKEFSFDFKLSAVHPPVLQGGTGLLDFMEAGSSFYYSRPRMKIAGSIALDGKTQAVTGQAWFDHQWGDFRTTVLGWDWFALQLDNGADVMLYQLRDAQGKPVLYSGTYSHEQSAELLTEAEFSTVPLSSWTSRSTGIRYPVEWRVQIPAKGVDVTLKPIVKDSEFDARLTTYNVYWEGPVNVQGSHPGKGFVEMSAYKK